MKITKRMLKQIIKEEFLREDEASDQARAAELARRASGREVHRGRMLGGWLPQVDTEVDPLHTPKELGSLSTMTADQRKQKEAKLKDVEAKLKKHQSYLAEAEQYLDTLQPRAIAKPMIEKKIAQLRLSIERLESLQTSLARDLDLGELEWPGNEGEAREDYMYPPTGPSSSTPAGKPWGRRFSGLEEHARITKNTLKQLIEEELQEAGFQMAPGADESDPAYGEQITGQLYDYGVEDAHAMARGAEEEDMVFSDDDDLADEIMVDPGVTDIRSMGAPYDRAIATVRESHVTKRTLQQMIMKEMQIMLECIE